MMKKETLNTLILRHGDRMLRQAGWPDTVDMAPVAPETVPGWLAACGSLSGVEILTLTEQLCQPLTYGRAALLLASARRLAGTPARLHLFPVQAYPHPERLADCQVIRLPYAQEWLTAAECDDLLAFLKASLTQISEIVHRDTKRIAAALTPSVNPRLMDRRIGDWRLLAVEYDHDNCRTKTKPTGWIRSSMPFLFAMRDSARSCSPRLTSGRKLSGAQGLSLISCVLRTLRSGAGLIAGF